MKKLLQSITLPFIVFGSVLLGGAMVATPAYAASPLDSTCANASLADSEVCKNRNDKLFGANSFWTRLINTMIFIVGSVAVLMLVVGGLRYVISGGDASQTKSAKDTILYSIIGVVIALMAYAIVNFVVVRLVG